MKKQGATTDDEKGIPFHCACPTPDPIHISLFDAWECGRCRRGIRALNSPQIGVDQ